MLLIILVKKDLTTLSFLLNEKILSDEGRIGQ